MKEDQGVLVVDELGRDDARVGTKGGLDHQSHAVGVQQYVIVAEQEEGRSIHHQGAVVTGRGESAVLVEEPHKGLGCDGGDPCGDVLFGPVRNHEQAEFLIVLGDDRGQCGFEAGARTSGNDDGDDGRSTGFHQYAKASSLELTRRDTATRSSRIPRCASPLAGAFDRDHVVEGSCERNGRLPARRVV